MLLRALKNKYWNMIIIGSVVAILLMFIYNICIYGTKNATYTPLAEHSWGLSQKTTTMEVSSGSGSRGSGSRGETECRRVLEKYFNKPFVSVRPAFLHNNVTGHNMELDCYNAELNLAVEYNGRQHYEHTPFFHASSDEFVKQQYRDEIKALLCRENAVILVVVPYTVHHDKIEGYLVQKLAEYGY